MQQLGGIDSLFLSMDSNRHPMHLASLMLVDPSAAPDGFSFDKVRQLYEARLHLVPPLRRRLVDQAVVAVGERRLATAGVVKGAMQIQAAHPEPDVAHHPLLLQLL